MAVEFKKLDRGLFSVEVSTEGYKVKYRTVPVVISWVLHDDENLTPKKIVRINFSMAVKKIDDFMKGIGDDEHLKILERL